MGKPRIRFKGYTDEWEERKFGEIFEEYSEKDHPELPTLTIIQGGGTVRRDESDRNILYDKDKIEGYKLVRKDDFILHLRSFEGGLEKATCDGVISPAYHIFHGKESDSRFYYAFFRSYNFIKRKLVPHIYGIRDGKSIDVKGMKSIIIPYPEFLEQKKIGDYIDAVDQFITLHQRKCEEIKTLKKYMLQKMFPQKGKNKPEIRFQGFTDAWEQRKVSDIATITAGGTPSTVEIEYWQPKEIPWLSSGEIHKKYVMETDNMISKKGLENSSAKWVEKGSVLIALAGQGKTRGTAAITKIRLTTNQSIAALKFGDNVYPDYAFQNLDSRYDELRNVSSGDGTRGGLNKQLLSDLEMMIPEYEEQKKLGDYFSNLDTLITLHQRKCDELKKVKKFMLQNMFPQD